MQNIVRLAALCGFLALPASGQVGDKLPGAALEESFAGAASALDRSALSVRLERLPRISSPGDIPTIPEVLRSAVITPEERLALGPRYPVFKGEPLTELDRAAAGHIILKFVDGARVRASNPLDLSLDATDIKTLRQRLRTLGPDYDGIDAADRAMLAEQGFPRTLHRRPGITRLARATWTTTRTASRHAGCAARRAPWVTPCR